MRWFAPARRTSRSFALCGDPIGLGAVDLSAVDIRIDLFRAVDLERGDSVAIIVRLVSERRDRRDRWGIGHRMLLSSVRAPRYECATPAGEAVDDGVPGV